MWLRRCSAASRPRSCPSPSKLSGTSASSLRELSLPSQSSARSRSTATSWSSFSLKGTDFKVSSSLSPDTLSGPDVGSAAAPRQGAPKRAAAALLVPGRRPRVARLLRNDRLARPALDPRVRHRIRHPRPGCRVLYSPPRTPRKSEDTDKLHLSQPVKPFVLTSGSEDFEMKRAMIHV
eukprot:72990-Rhodomonas_salina.1